MYAVVSIFSWLCLFILFYNTRSQDMYYSDNVIIGNLRKREVIPLAQINNPYGYSGRRRYNSNNEANLSYRWSRDIRENHIDRRFELTESQIREAKLAENKDNLDKLHGELRWLTIDTDEGIDQQPNMMFIGPQKFMNG